MNFQPELLQFSDGKSVGTVAEWEKRRREIIEILSREEYGYTPKAPKIVTGTLLSTEKTFCSGHAVREDIEISFETPGGTFRFPIQLFLPKTEGKHPTFVFLNFRPDPVDIYFPAEEVTDGGFAVAKVCYKDITSDDGDFSNGISAFYPRSDENTAWGKIGMWAFCASRIVDYLVTRPEIDDNNIAVVGHSRLGKTALWCGAQDERIKYVISNDSGCSGSAYERVKHEGAETIAVITERFPFWFCKNYLKYANHPEERPFDQHYLLSLTAPRYLLVASASLDDWADQYSEQLSCIGASSAWRLYGKPGYIGKEEPADVGDRFSDGCIHYHLRDGIHFFGRYDWNQYMTFIRSKMNLK